MVVNIFILSTLISFFILININISWPLYIFVFLTQIILIIIKIKFKGNDEFLNKILSANIGFFIVYCISNFINHKELFSGSLEALIFNFILCVLIISLFFLVLNRSVNEYYHDCKRSVIPKRSEDLQHLLYNVNNFQIVGLNGEWGSGKTFLVNELKEKLKDEYEFIEIDLLVSNLNEMQLTLINLLEELLLSKGIIPRYSSKIKRDLTSVSFFTKVNDVLNLIFKSNDSKAEALKSFIEETKKINKKILIIYEDVDRIENNKVIKEIFAITEKISDAHIKVIYQYDESLLLRQGFDYSYIEKYIPFKMNLTKLHLIEILSFELKGKYLDVLSTEDFKFLTLQNFRFNVMTEFIGLDNECCLQLEYIPFRKVKHMLDELYSALIKKRDLQVDSKELVISFFIIKHFLPEQYEKLNIKETVFESINFTYKEKSYTILELIDYSKDDSHKDDLEEIFSVKENQVTYGVLKLLNFELLNQKSLQKNRYEELKKVMKYQHEKNNRIIWKLLFEGKSMTSDFELAVKKMCEEVLDKPKLKQKEAFNNYLNEFFYTNKIIDDNTTIFKMGMDKFENLFEAFKIVNVSDEYRIKLYEFYFETRASNSVDLGLIKCMNYFPLNSDIEYLQVIKHFNAQNISGNFNNVTDFLFFVRKYIRALGDVEIINSYEHYERVGMDDIEDFDKEISYIKYAIKKILIEIENEMNIFSMYYLNKFINMMEEIKLFLNKILDIINFSTTITIQSWPLIRTEISSSYSNQDEYDRLKGLILDEGNVEDIQDIIESSYKSGAISAYEISKLLKDIG